MEQGQQGIVDLIEIYHARCLRDDLLAQLRRIRSSQTLPLQDHVRRQALRREYETLLQRVTGLLERLGDVQS